MRPALIAAYLAEVGAACYNRLLDCGPALGTQAHFFDAKEKAMKRVALLMLAVLILGVRPVQLVRADDAQQKETKQFTVYPIGWVSKADDQTTIVLEKKYERGLVGLDGFSHVYVLWWFDRHDTPKMRSPRDGVFGCRCPFRPNPIALTLCKIVSVKENVLEVEKIDAFADTPVLDLKPFIPGYDSASDATMPK